jgi:hypothetical protein
MSVDISVSITEDVVDIISTPTVNIVNVTNSASIDPGLYDLSEFTNTSVNPFVRTSGLSAYVPTTRTISTTSPLTGGGDLSANRTLSIPKATTLVDGYLSAADWTIFNGKQNALGFTPVPTTRTLTINGTTQDLSADRTFTISTGITIGTTAITSGTVGRVLFEGTGNVVQESGNITWDDTNKIFKVSTGTNGIVIEGDAGGYPTLKINTLRSGTTRRNWMIATEQINAGDFVLYRSSIGGGVANTLVYSIFNDGNFGLNTSTNAGFKLDVNGTAVFRGATAITGNVTISNASNLSVSNGVVGIDSNVAENNSYGSFNFGVNQTGSYAWIQSYNSRPIVLNSLANNVIIGSTTNVASAKLIVTSTTQGFLPPRGTNAQMLAIASPAKALIFFDTTNNKLNCYDGTTWQPCW